MQNSVIHIVKELEGAGKVDSRLSFDGFIHFLKRRRQADRTMRVKFLDFVIHYFEERLQGKQFLDVEEIGQYSDLFELVYTVCFPPVADERETAWALGVPVKPIIIYGTDFFYNQLRDPETHAVKACMIDEQDQVRTKVNLELIYSMILLQCYNYTLPAGSTVIRSLRNQETGLPGYYRLNIDSRFVEVSAKNKLPPFDPSQLDTKRPVKEVIDRLLEHLPLECFVFSGISALTVTDVTEEYVVDSVKNLILNPDACDESNHHSEVLRYLTVLAGTKDVSFGLLPLLQVNGRAVYSESSCYHSIIGESAESGEEDTEKIYLALMDEYFKHPKQVLYETLPEPAAGEHFFFGTLRQAGVVSYAMVPVYYNNRVAGVLEVSARKAGVLTADLLARLDVLIPLLAQLLQRGIDEFEADLKAIVKENFTSIQPAVEWKFNEAAWHHERMREMGKEPARIETIYFKDVYPLYGAVDIRNSTIERNSALRRDLQTQFRLLTETLSSLQKVVELQLLDELLHQAQKWEQAMNGALTTADELNLNSFLRDKVDFFLRHFRETRPDLADLITPYLQATEEAEGEAFVNRRELETSIQLVNRTVNRWLEETIAELQKSYPFYFEKFRTDGVEYDIYIGQSISPMRPFDLLYLRNLRLWQLKSMAMIARETHKLLPEMATPLQTTQLIFVHSTSIDISFRKDERRFDVEGGYNIRYQVVKKRIDKVRVQDTNERLTQPGKIAIIYFNDREGEEYEGYIKYLQEKGVFALEVEHLELEELQGVSGLRALRVGVLW
ncbi:MAG TPA: GAF domain-containing protein [Puia sp.]|uniref:GAF domain-containing protein n=1 Tax=Puia sp. TaxID=2045100 RepID=UPI002C7C0BED|nr:GAF domain-containing protein [Puia sp.]HVU94989.1 GAF domain-containing protein [Puia sp.]